MAEIKKISTELQLLDKFLDTSGDAGTSGQVLTSTGTGINWVSGGSLPGGPYLPLSAGSSYPLTGDLYLDDGSGATPSLYFKNGDDNFWRYLMESGGDFSIKEGTSTRLTFQAGGNVGIGATSPGAKLDVDGSIRLSTSGTVEGRSYPYTTNIGSGANATTTNIKAGSTDKSEISLIGGDVGDRIEFKTNSTERMRIDSSGNVGIGTTVTTAALNVLDSTSTAVKATRIGNDTTSIYSYATQADAVLAWTCGSYYNAEVVITASQTNGGDYNNLYIRGIWSNNHTSHHWDELEHVGGLTGSTITMSVGQNGSTTNSGRLELDFNYISASFATLNIRVTDFYGSHSYTIT